MRKLVVVVAIVEKNLVRGDLGSCPNLSTNVQRKLGKGFLDVSDELVDVQR
jgi:hypothetical protein